MLKKQEKIDEEHCVNHSVFQEYISTARLVHLNALLLSFAYTISTCYRLVYSFTSCFSFLFFTYSENDLEEVLTFYTQKNKSATVFLGTKVRGVKKDIHDMNFPEDSGNGENSKRELRPCFSVNMSGLCLILYH